MALDPALVERALIEATKRAENLDYFFDRLTSPDWIEPLAERGFFSDPPPQVVDDEGYVRTPGWSASRYLARMAEHAPDIVTDLIESITTNNERVHEDFIDAALLSPPDEARRLAEREAVWIAETASIYYLLPRKSEALMERLVAIGEIDSAMKLARALFVPLADTRDVAWYARRLRARFNDWEYDQLLRRFVDNLVPAAPREALQTLIELLEDALRQMRTDDQDGGPPHYDLSRSWRVRIGDDRGRADEIEESLASAVRDATELVRERELMSDAELIRALVSRPERIFRRIALFALARGREPDLVDVHDLVMDREELLDPEPSPEFRDLLRANAARLSPTDVAMLVGAIEAGPDVADYRRRAVEFGDREATDEDVEAHVSRWRAGRLALLESALSGDAQQRYEALAAQAGDIEIPVSWEIRTFAGDTSPASAEELAEMDDDQLIAYLRDWQPTGAWDAPSVEGLARVLATFVESDPERSSRLAPEFKALPPAYVQWILHGFQGALRQEKNFTWRPVIELLWWISQQPRERPEGPGDEDGDGDPGWVWTRREVVSLIEAGFSTTAADRIPFTERESVWRVIAAVAEDPDPTPEHESRYGGSNMDPATLSLNATRPRALRAAIAYAVWVYQALKSDDQQAPFEGSLFERVPEVPALLTPHLDPSVDPSVAVRAVFGQFFANLLAMDRAWAAEHVSDVFPHEDTALREAGWGAYVIYNGAYNNVLELLRDQYARAAELAGSEAHGFRWLNGDPREKLGEHLAVFYWRGVIALDDPIFLAYWNNAHRDARAHLLEFVGRSARELDELEPELVDRLQALWEFAKTGVSAGSGVSELSSFAWWFASRALPVGWRIAELRTLLESGAAPNPAFFVAEELPAIAEGGAPDEAVRLFRRLLENERESWSVSAWRDQITQVLRIGIASPEEETRRVTEDAIHWLGAKGHREFRNLLSDAAASDL